MQIPIPCRVRLVFRSVIVQMIACWAFGLVLGTLFSAGLDSSFLSLMRRLFLCPVSIVIHLILAVLPFLICTYAFVIRRNEIVLAVLFCKAFIFSAFAFSASLIFGSAGWLILPMLQLPDFLLMPMLCWFCMRKRRVLMRDHLICIGAVIFTVLIHYFAVLPFVAELID